MPAMRQGESRQQEWNLLAHWWYAHATQPRAIPKPPQCSGWISPNRFYGLWYVFTPV